MQPTRSFPLTCMSRLRSIVSSMAVSMVMIPATHAADISPTLCPTTALGTTPRDRHSSASDHSSATSAGCVYCVWSKR